MSSIENAQEPLLKWTAEVAQGEWDNPFPLEAKAFPEAVGSLWSFSYINRFSHVVMDGSPIEKTFDGGMYRSITRFFGHELKYTLTDDFEPGRALDLVSSADTSVDIDWAAGNSRIKEAFERWTATVERHANRAVPQPVRELVEQRVADWYGEAMPISRQWVDDEVRDLKQKFHRTLARFGLLIAVAPYQVGETLAGEICERRSESHFVRLLSWASLVGARRIADGVAAANNNILEAG